MSPKRRVRAAHGRARAAKNQLVTHIVFCFAYWMELANNWFICAGIKKSSKTLSSGLKTEEIGK
jgi:hypothetical protein